MFGKTPGDRAFQRLAFILGIAMVVSYTLYVIGYLIHIALSC